MSRGVFDGFSGPGGLIDRDIGEQYETVKFVADNMPLIAQGPAIVDAVEAAGGLVLLHEEAVQLQADISASAALVTADKNAAAASAASAQSAEDIVVSSTAGASASASASAVSAAAALVSQNAAATSATASAASATTAGTSATSAVTAKTAAEAARDLALTYRNQASAIAGGDFIATSDKAAINGVASLDGSGHVPAGQLSLTKSQVGLTNADNTSDVNKPISTAQQAALDQLSADAWFFGAI
jgi:hypothetical protein